MELEADAYRELFDANPLPMFVSDRETLRILAANRAMCALYGWSRDELLAMTLRDIRPPEELQRFEQSFADPRKTTQQTYSRAARHRTKDGRTLDVSLEITRIDFGGRPASLAVVTDMTGIEHAQRRFQLLVEHSADGISLTNANNIVEYVSPAGARILGYQPGEIVGTSSEPRAHPDDVLAWIAPAPGETKHNVARIAHRDGTWRWIESMTTNLTHDPAVRAFVSNYRDITARKAAERALQESQQRLEFLLSATDAITYSAPATVDPPTTFISANVQDVLGHTPEDFTASNAFWFDNIHPDDHAAVTAGLAELMRDGAVAMQYRFRHRDGSYRWMRDVARIVRDASGKDREIVGYWIDVTDQVRAEAERERDSRSAALADRMLSIGRLAMGVAHELNNPLAYVTANLELLAAEVPKMTLAPRSRLTPESLRGLVADAREGVERMGTIVRDLRLLSRPDDEQHGPVDLVAVLASSVKMAYNEIRHRARIVTDYPDDVPLVQADASRLGQVFLNLVLNAAQSIAEGHADLNEVRIAIVKLDDARVRVDISDTGVGIAPEHMGRIFDPFFTTKAPGLGTGLGLSISHQLVRAIGGEIAADSTPGRGSTFSVTLPLATTASRPATLDDDASRCAARILLVDDEAAVGRSLTLLLAPEAEVVAVTRAGDALARIARGERFDAILCDLMMPEISGVELYRQLEHTAPECTQRIIFMTGGAFTPQAREFLARTDRPHIEKPFSEAQLRRAIELVVG